MAYISFTEEERLEIYKLGLVYLKSEFKSRTYAASGFCWAFMKAENVLAILKYDKFSEKYPEIFTYKPKDLTTLYWFPCTYSGVKKRIGILKAIIAKMESHD